MTVQPACPICSTEFETWRSVMAHISGQTDDEHKGKSGPEVVDDHRSGNSEPAENGESAENSESDGNGVTFPENPDADTDEDSTDDDRIDLPCGHDFFDPEEAPDPPFHVQCDECGQTFTVTDL